MTDSSNAAAVTTTATRTTIHHGDENDRSCTVQDDDDVPFFFPQPKQPQQPQDDNTATVTPYRYIRFEQIDSACGLTVQKGTLCWVSLSQGKNRTSRLFKPARVIRMNDNDENAQKTPPNKATKEGDPRVCVQYPKGSTYWVRSSNLMPVLEHHRHLVLVTSETTDYRRVAMVHTTAEDHFIEIGCDFGILVSLVKAKSALGVDKSETSIDVARKNYPTLEFLLGDIFEDDDHRMRALPYPGRSAPLVVAIDINGNRDLPAVVKCIELVLTWSPRLIVVKSRALYAKMTKGQDNKPS